MLTRGRVALAAFAGVLALSALLLSPEALFERVRAVVLSPWFPLLLLAGYLVRFLLGWPITLFSVLVGYRYGVMPGFFVAWAGTVVSSLPTYLTAGRLEFDGLLGRAADGGRRYFSEAGDLRGLVAARLAPTPAEAVSGAAGVAGVPLWAFVVGTLVGELPWTAAAVVAGASLERYTTTVPTDPLLVVGALLAALALLAGPAYRTLSERRR